jgi:hypothetical protein
MITTSLNRANAHIWGGFFPVAKRITRKGKIVFTAIDGSGEKTYISTGTFTNIDEFYSSIYKEGKE